MVVQFTHSDNEVRYCYVQESMLAMGAQTTVIVGPPTSTRVLVQNEPLGYSRGTALAQSQAAQLLAGGLGSA